MARSAEVAITRIPTDGPPLFTAYLRDISERKRAEQQRNVRLAVIQALAESGDVDEVAGDVRRHQAADGTTEAEQVAHARRQADVSGPKI